MPQPSTPKEVYELLKTPKGQGLLALLNQLAPIRGGVFTQNFAPGRDGTGIAIAAAYADGAKALHQSIIDIMAEGEKISKNKQPPHANVSSSTKRGNAGRQKGGGSGGG